jgi:hypothetical protein
VYVRMFTCMCIHITSAAKIPAVHRLDSRSAITIVELLKHWSVWEV